MEATPYATPNHDAPRVVSAYEVGSVPEGFGLYAGSMALALLGMDLNKHRNVVSVVPGATEEVAEATAEEKQSEYADLREYLQKLTVRQQIKIQPSEFDMRSRY